MSGTRPLSEALPELYAELVRLLREEADHSLADDLPKTHFHEWCGCGDDFCQSFRTAPDPEGPYGPGHRMVCLLGEGDRAMINLDLVHESVVYVEVLYRPNLRTQFRTPV
ncbi:hypothetical protein [Embleya sp. NPDC005971]|uniref:hypothetical protein n=1 Tax=Embleya sp. NPDC005971 TaxID=3156724 RepID=UPI0033CC4EA7